MKSIHIFKPGRHSPMSGGTLSFSEADLAASAAAYDPALHEAPIVVGHPKDNGPAYGWIKGVTFSAADGLVASADQVDTAFAELVSAGRFKKVSASFYAPDAPANPSPGVYYLRHVGFLGARPPAVKGLRAVEFGETEEGVVEFGDWADQQNASLWRRMREWLLAQFGKDAADQVAPDYMLEGLFYQAAQPEPATADQATTEAATTQLGFTEGDPVNAQELASQKAALDQRDAELKARETAATAKEASFAEREQALAEAQKKQRKADIESFVDDLVKAGQLLPKDKARTVAFMEALPETASVVEFGEGDKPVETPALKVFQEFLKTLPKQVDFSERARRDATAVEDDNVDPQSLANAALEFQEAESKAGRHVSLEVAMQHVIDKKAA